MINKILLSVYLLLVAATSFGQRELQGSIKGTLRDSAEHQVLKQATVSVLHKDTSIISQALSGDDGNFIIKNIPTGNFILKISYSSYETRFSNFTIDSNNTALNAGIIYMQPHAHELAEVVVQTP